MSEVPNVVDHTLRTSIKSKSHRIHKKFRNGGGGGGVRGTDVHSADWEWRKEEHAYRSAFNDKAVLIGYSMVVALFPLPPVYTESTLLMFLMFTLVTVIVIRIRSALENMPIVYNAIDYAALRSFTLIVMECAIAALYWTVKRYLVILFGYSLYLASQNNFTLPGTVMGITWILFGIVIFAVIELFAVHMYADWHTPHSNRGKQHLIGDSDDSDDGNRPQDRAPEDQDASDDNDVDASLSARGNGQSRARARAHARKRILHHPHHVLRNDQLTLFMSLTIGTVIANQNVQYTFTIASYILMLAIFISAIFLKSWIRHMYSTPSDYVAVRQWFPFLEIAELFLDSAVGAILYITANVFALVLNKSITRGQYEVLFSVIVFAAMLLSIVMLLSHYFHHVHDNPTYDHIQGVVMYTTYFSLVGGNVVTNALVTYLPANQVMWIILLISLVVALTYLIAQLKHWFVHPMSLHRPWAEVFCLLLETIANILYWAMISVTAQLIVSSTNPNTNQAWQLAVAIILFGAFVIMIVMRIVFDTKLLFGFEFTARGYSGDVNVDVVQKIE